MMDTQLFLGGREPGEKIDGIEATAAAIAAAAAAGQSYSCVLRHEPQDVSTCVSAEASSEAPSLVKDDTAVAEEVEDDEILPLGSHKSATPTTLHAAADVDEVKRIMSDQGASVVNVTNEKGETALYCAVGRGQTDVVQYLVENCGADVGVVTTLGTIALHVAAYKGYLEAVQHLLRDDTTINTMSQRMGQTPINLASRYGYEAIVTFLLSHGADSNQPNLAGETPLFCAAQNGHLNIVICLVERGGSISVVDHPDTFGASPFFIACMCGHLPVVEYLSAAIDMSKPRNDDMSPLMVAAWSGHLDIVKFLVAKGCNPAERTDFGRPGAKVMMSNRRQQQQQQYPGTFAQGVIVASNGYNVMQRSSTYSVLLDNGFVEENVEGMHIKRVGAVKDRYGEYGESPLHLAAENGHIGIIRYLAEDCRVSLYGATNDGRTALHVAATNGRTDVTMYLLSKSEEEGRAQDEEKTPGVHYSQAKLFYSVKDHYGKTFLDNMNLQHKLDFLTCEQMRSYAVNRLTANNYYLFFNMIQQVEPPAWAVFGSGGELWANGDAVMDHTDGDPHMETMGILNVDDFFEETNFHHCDKYKILIDMVRLLVSEHPELAIARDTHGRLALDVASKVMKKVMQQLLLYHGRYRVTEPRPEHASATCFVLKAVDERTLDPETNDPVKVALKLMRVKAQFARELTAREGKYFSPEHVMNVMQAHPQRLDQGSADMVTEAEADIGAGGQLTKIHAEKLFLLVMPLAERNLFVALKQERWPGKNMEEVRHVCMQLVRCVEHMHNKGVLHADLKPLNVVRMVGQWKLIDLDAACAIGTEFVGHKGSSAYAPPEAIHVDESSGCILYQMVTPDVRPLFQGGQDDTLTDNPVEEDNLFALAEWSTESKQRKLARVGDKMARNLLSQMLHKDPLQRPSLVRVLAHPFLSGKKVARMVGDKATYDVFLSYRVAADAHHVKKLHTLLISQGLKVYWDVLCLASGVDWEQGFCEGLMSSKTFIPLLSRDAINHPDKDSQNFSKLTADQPNCDNVFLEHRLAIELERLGFVEKVFPVFIGNVDLTTGKYGDYFADRCHPKLPDVAVAAVEDKLRHHMESQALGTPLDPDRTVKSVVDAITACQGAFIQGEADAAFQTAADKIVAMVTEVLVAPSPRSAGGPTRGPSAHLESASRLQEIDQLRAENSRLRAAAASSTTHTASALP